MDEIKKLLSSLTPRQILTIAVCAAAVVFGVVAFSHWQRESGMRPLYTSLSPEDASAMVQKLRESGVDYRIGENGTTVLVPEQRVPELRLEMAGLGLPKTGRIGFEIFDKTNFGITDFAEHVNYRRAVEGELERSIMAISEVQQARVHVTLPKDSVFTDAREPAKASVLVGLRPASRLSPQNVVAITNLVSSAVEGLSPEAVSVVDMQGNLLSRPHRDGLSDGVQVTEAALDYRQAIEHDLAVKINNTLEPLLGPDKFRAGVSAEVDMTSGEQSEETFDPSRSVMVSSQKTEDSTSNSRGVAAGAPGVAANLPPQTIVPSNAPAPNAPAAQTTAQPGQATAQQQPAQPAAQRPAGNTSNTTRRTENVTFQSSRMTKHLKLPQGTVKRLSIAVLLDQGSKVEGTGAQAHRVVTPFDPDKLKAIQAIVSTVAGLDMQRGDQLTVEALPFDNSVALELTGTAASDVPKKTNPGFSLETLKQKPTLLWGSVTAGVFVIGMLFLMMRGKRRTTFEVRESLPATSVAAGALPNAGNTVAQSGAAGLTESRQLPALLPSRTEVLLTQIQENAKNNPEVWAGILRGWLTEEEPS